MHEDLVELRENLIDESMRYLNVDVTFEDQIKPHSYYVEDRVSSNSGIKCIQKIKEMSMKRSELKPIVLVLKKLL